MTAFALSELKEPLFPDAKQLDSLRSRLSAQGGFCAQVAEQLLSEGAVGEEG
ncbi:hypothetical protein [Streptomyces sp. Ncost-T10-10d]|uniref:hypothetical protein n=1 Tax=Streptomyces sp. Ncost-T10-10d TaxID=1839774 RepID=UPI00081E0A13|nr:hypothetical protein [Streptomyces sp. Ncost-T10-10d]SCF56938.1 hypothetical protein GA0115254_103710 [Streptomyces sp. Ncost-T10-10d]